ncbi:MAG: hypothetical protein V7K77_25995 [Nostoc sp.]|uniref:hypothetical protein n=1 Tax=Nostoc sp. TaxID=1180 RepID=UPI002FFC3470
MEGYTRLQRLYRQLPGFTLSLWVANSSKRRVLVGHSHRPTRTARVGIEPYFEVVIAI